LISLFYDPNVNDEQFEARVLVDLLKDEKLRESVSAGILQRIAHSTLYDKDATESSSRDESTFKAYRASALRRQAIRRELQIDTTEKLSALALRQEQVLRRFDQTIEAQNGAFKPDFLANAV